MNQRKTAVRMIGDDPKMRRLARLPADERNVSGLGPLDRLPPSVPAARAQPIVPGLPPVSIDIGSRETGRASSDDDQADAVHSPAGTPAMPPARSFEFTRGIYKGSSSRHGESGSGTIGGSEMNPPPRDSCPPGAWIETESPVGMSGSPLKFGPFAYFPMQSSTYRFWQSGRIR